MVIVLTGVSGSGKTTVGRQLAAELDWPFRDADEFHPPANIARMTAGRPLTEGDRAPWLAAIRAYVDDCLARGQNAVVTCSALRESHRRALLSDPARVKLVCLDGDEAILRGRLARRQGHFMKEAMLASQRATFEAPSHALVLDVALTPAQLVTGIRRAFSV